MPLCGSGDDCREVVPERGLCARHAAELRLIASRWPASHRSRSIPGAAPTPLPPPSPPPPPKQEIDPSNVFVTDKRAATIDRAVWMARWVHVVGEPVRRADAVRVAGLDPLGGSGRVVLERATAAGWIRRGHRGAVSPGDVVPPDA